MNNPTKSQALLKELIEAKIINPNVDKAKVDLIIRKHLSLTFYDGIQEERTAHNKKVYVEPINHYNQQV